MEEQLKKLLELQRLSLRVVQMDAEMETIPGRIEEAGVKIKASEEKAAGLKGQKEEAEKEVRRLGGQMEDAQQKISGYKSKLNSKDIKTNEQYRAMEKQIEQAEESSYQILEQQYEAEELVKRVSSEMKQHETEHRDVVGECEQERAVLEEKRKGMAAERDELAGRIGALEDAIDPATLSVFKRVAAVRHGVGLARVVGETCMACHVRLRPQLVCEVKLLTELHHCDNCKRILFWAGNQAAAPASEAETAS